MLNKKYLLIDGTLLTNEPSGIGLSTEQTINNLDNLVNIALVCRSSYDVTKLPKGLNIICIPRALPRVLYMHFMLPVIALLLGIHNVWIPSARRPIMGLGRKYFITHYDNTWALFPETMTPLQAWLEKIQVPNALKKADKIFAISQAVHNETIEILDDPKLPIETIHLGVLPRIQTPQNTLLTIPVPRPYFFFIGNMEPRKNLNTLIKAFNDERLLQYSLIIAGVRRKDIALKANDNVLFIDKYITEDEKFELIKNAVGLCFPSLYEGFGIPILEANLMSTPIVMSNIAVMREIGSDTGIFVDPHCHVSLADGIHSLATHKFQFDADCFSKNLARFSYSKTAQAIHDAIFEQ